MAASPPSQGSPSPSAPTVERLLKEDLDVVLECFPDFNKFFWDHSKEKRMALRRDWQDKWEHPEWDYSGKCEALRKWVTQLRDNGIFNVGSFDRTARPSKFTVGQEVRCRDKGEEWRYGVVKSIDPFKILPHGDEAGRNWKDAHWDEVEALPFVAGQRVRCRDKDQGWKLGVVKALDPLRVMVDGIGGAHTYDEVEIIPDLSEAPEVEATRETSMCPICLSVLSPGDKLVELPCHHLFEKSCLLAWFRRNPSCPLCKEDVSANAVTAEQESTCCDGGKEEAGEETFAEGARVAITGLEGPGEILNGKLGKVCGQRDGLFLVEVGEEDEKRQKAVGKRHLIAVPEVTKEDYRAGDRVMVVGLKGEASLNGTQGTVRGWKENRVAVALHGHGGRKALLPANLLFIPDRRGA